MKSVVDVNVVKERLNAYLEGHPTVTGRRIADAIGRSTGTISAFRGGVYKGDNEAIAGAIATVLDAWEDAVRQGLGGRRKVYETGTYQKIWNTLKRSHVYPGITVITADNGVGKTFTLKQYANETNAVLVEAHPGYSPKALVLAVCRKLRLEEGHNINTMLDMIEQRAPETLLIVDEAENLPIKTLDIARRIHDKTRLNLVLVGSHELYASLHSRKVTHRYLVGRVDLYEEARNLSLPEVYEVLTDTGLEMDTRVKEMLVTYSQNNFRVLDNLLRLVGEFCRKLKTDRVTPNIVNNAKERLLVLN